MELQKTIQEHMDSVMIYYISITPTPDRWAVWDNVSKTNELIKTFAAETDNFEFIDFTNDFLLPDGTPDSKLFKMDGLHLNQTGYAIWTQKIILFLE